MFGPLPPPVLRRPAAAYRHRPQPGPQPPPLWCATRPCPLWTCPSQSQILNLLSDLKEKQNLTYLFITHDLSVVKYISDRIGVMYLGNMVELGPHGGAVRQHPAPLHRGPALRHSRGGRGGQAGAHPAGGRHPQPRQSPPSGCKFHTRCRYCQQKCKEEVPEWTNVGNDHYVACHFPLHKKEG